MDHPGFVSDIKSQNRRSERHSISTSKKFAFSAITCLLFFLVIEITLACLGWSFRIPTDSNEQDHWFGLGFQQDPTLPWSWIPVPGGKGIAGSAPFHFDKPGFRKQPDVKQEKPEDTIRIVCMGDSCTMGWEVLDGQTFCSVLGNIIQKSFSKTVETINAGIPGYTSFQGLHQLESRILSLQPDFIVFSYCWNDHTFAIHMHETLDVLLHKSFFGLPDKDLPGPTLVSKMHSSLSRLRSYQALDYLVRKARPKKQERAKLPQEFLVDIDQVAVRVSINDYKENLKRMIELSRDNGVIPILMNQPSQPLRSNHAFEELAKSLNYAAPSEESWSQFCRLTRNLFVGRQEEYNEAMMEVAQQNAAEFLDMISVFKQYDPEELLIDPVHPTPKGHFIIAEELSKKILQYQSITSR